MFKIFYGNKNKKAGSIIKEPAIIL